ncbi:MAG: ribose 5-phosphate isomerase A, partial [Candidatus Dadabacteria bacterium]|nr:ribose 5-phosphate isomerase A [Candidatus Dadabacteria bacterium]
MTPPSNNGVSLQNRLKKEAGISAVDFVESAMVLGLGTGSTTIFALEELVKRLKEGRLKDI